MTEVEYNGSYEYLSCDGAELFTVILLPRRGGRFPTVICRNPYVDNTQDAEENEVVLAYLRENSRWLKNGYAVVYQHCRGRGKSSGDCIPYIHEREDGLQLQQWVRHTNFYNGELYLVGGSYLASVHYATAPFAPDIRGAVLQIQDCERYNICYRHGALRKGLHGDWYVGMYKRKTMPKKNYTPRAFETLPLSEFSRTVFGEPAEDFDEMLRHPDPSDAFWNTRAGGADARDAVKHAGIPILFTTGFYDLYDDGVFTMWEELDPETRRLSALVVSPYDHGDSEGKGLRFPGGHKTEKLGMDYDVRWLNFVRGRDDAPAAPGMVTYYRLFENRWQTDGFPPAARTMRLPLGRAAASFVYNPFDPPYFKGGLSGNFGEAEFQDPPDSRGDRLSLYTQPFAEDTFVRGRMTARLRVRTDCEDTDFYVRVSLAGERGDYGLQDDISSVCRQHPDYVPGNEAELDFTFDMHAFLIRRGERLRIDISSADAAHYVRHTNNKGLYSVQATARTAHNTVLTANSWLQLPVE